MEQLNVQKYLQEFGLTELVSHQSVYMGVAK